MYVEQLIQLLYDKIGENGCDKSSEVYLDFYAGVSPGKIKLPHNLIYVDDNGDIHIDAEVN